MLSTFLKDWITYVSQYAHTTDTHTLSLHDALPISEHLGATAAPDARIADSELKWSVHGVHAQNYHIMTPAVDKDWTLRSEEHTSELQSQSNLVCRLLLEKKKN